MGSQAPHGHGWRQCPKRSSQSTGNFQGKGAKKGTYWIESLTPSSLSTVFMVTENEIIYDTAGYGVLDIGATETVTSLESLEKLLHLRRERGNDDPGALRVVANGRKPFRFGNGEVQTSESFILLRQHLGKRSIYLGMYTLNVEKVPILVGVKTLTKLGAIIDVKGQCMVLTSVDENTKIPLKKSSSGHLLVDLTQNWLNDGQPLMFHETSPSASSVYMVQAADPSAHSRVSEQFDQFSSQLSIHELAGMLHHDHEFREDPDVMMVNEGEGEGDMSQEANLEILEEAMVLTSEHHDLRPLAQVTQDQRERVMRSFITSTNRPSSILDSHGAQEGEGGGAQGRALRLLADGTGPPCHGERGPTRAGLQDRFQQVRHVGNMSSLWNTHDLHACVRQSWHDQEGRPIDPRHEGANREERRDQGDTFVEEREDQPRRSREVSREAVGLDSGQEGSLESYAGSEGQGQGRLLAENDLPASKASSTAAPPEMSSTPGRKAVRRPAEMGPEEKEYYLRRGGDEEEWSQVSEVAHSTP